jgi:DNA mismatch repair protein MutS2
MRERDLKALEFDKVIHLVMELCASEPGRDASAGLRPSIDPAEVQRRLTATAEMVDLRSHAGSIPISEFTDQRPFLLAAARAGAILGGEALVKVRDFIVGSRHVSGFLRSRRTCSRRRNSPTRCSVRSPMTARSSMTRAPS